MIEILLQLCEQIFIGVHQIWKLWLNFMCPLGPFLLAQSHLLKHLYLQDTEE